MGKTKSKKYIYIYLVSFIDVALNIKLTRYTYVFENHFLRKCEIQSCLVLSAVCAKCLEFHYAAEWLEKLINCFKVD